ncbi:MAG: HAMP domain-containing sensor histidine kinase [Pseudomonadota bacterium]
MIEQSHCNTFKQVYALVRTVLLGASGALFSAVFTAGAVAQSLSQSPAYTPWAIGFYSFAVTVVLIFLLLNVAVKNAAGLYISALHVGMLLSIWMLEDGLIGLVPDMGRPLNDSFVLSIGHLTGAIGFICAAQVYHPDQVTPRIKQILWGLALVALVTIPVLWVLQDFTLWMGVANTLIVLMIGGQVAATRTWRTHDSRRRIIPLMTALLALAACGVILVIYLVSDGRVWIEQGAILRFFFVIVTFPTMLAVLFELNDMRLDRDKALVEAVQAARKDAETSADLLEMEKQYARARAVADARTRQLSEASHDIRQPIASMRAELDAMRGDSSEPLVDRLERALDHLNDLTSELSAAGSHAPEAGLHGDVQSETLGVTVLFDTLDKLFSAEAGSRHIRLGFSNSKTKVSAPPLILVRILSNLITNAIMHSDASRVLVGVRRRDEAIRFDVLDNGNGFDHGTADWAFEHGRKGSESAGTGQGLSIVKELAAKYEIGLDVWTEAGVGTRVSMSVPRAPEIN